MLGNKADQKINELDKRYEAIQEERNALRQKYEQMKSNIESIKEERIACADNGDTEKYRSLSEDLHRAEDDLFVAERRLAKLQQSPFTNEEIRAAWDQYHVRYADEIDSQVKQFAKLKSDLLDAYRVMLDTQEKALAVRKHLFEYMDGKTKEKGIGASFPIKSIPCRKRNGFDPAESAGLLDMAGVRADDPDFLYFISDYATRKKIDNLQLFRDEAVARALSIIELS